MTERDVWVKGVVTEPSFCGEGTSRVLFEYQNEKHETRTIALALPTGNMRPRTDGAELEPTGDVARLREACHEAVTWLGIEVYPTKHSQRAAAILRQVLSEIPDGPVETCLLERLRGVCAWAMDVLECPQLYTDQGRTDLQAALRAALAATPAPAKIEGPVREGDVLRLEVRAMETDQGNGVIDVMTPTSGAITLNTRDLTILSRPAPVNKCGGCAHFVQGHKHGICDCDTLFYVTAEGSACSDCYDPCPPEASA